MNTNKITVNIYSFELKQICKVRKTNFQNEYGHCATTLKILNLSAVKGSYFEVNLSETRLLGPS